MVEIIPCKTKGKDEKTVIPSVLTRNLVGASREHSLRGAVTKEKSFDA
jgi:hypothetical protein